MLIHGGDGRILKVHYKGQRGEGVYDLNWEGLIKNVERRYRETGSDTMKQEYEQFIDVYKRQALGLPGLYTTKSSAKVLADAILEHSKIRQDRKEAKTWSEQIAR